MGASSRHAQAYEKHPVLLGFGSGGGGGGGGGTTLKFHVKIVQWKEFMGARFSLAYLILTSLDMV